MEYLEHSEWISNHLSRFYTDNEMKVFHEMLSLHHRIDVYWIDSENHDFNILLTSGMSSKAMSLDDAIEEKAKFEFAELMMLIPKTIQFEDFQNNSTKNGWIISMLKTTARFPHDYKTWLQIGHTIQADADMGPYSPNTSFVGCAILPSMTFEEDFTTIEKDGRQINFYTLFPLYENEFRHKLANGFNGLVDLLRSANPNEVFDLNRPNMMV